MNTNGGLVVDHIDRNKHNNNSDNLRWVTAKENSLNHKLHDSSEFGRAFINKFGFSKTGHESMYADARYYWNKIGNLNDYEYHQRKGN